MKKVCFLILLVFTTAGSVYADSQLTPVLPADGAKNVTTGIVQWSPSDSGTVYDLYLGTEKNPPLYKKALRRAEEKPVMLELDRKYYWKVVARKNDIVIKESKTFSFSTLPISLNPSLKYTPFVDIRDYQIYWSAEIGGKKWMVMNLNYEAPGVSWNYNNAEGNSVYGRLYGGKAVAEGSLAPAGWHIPSEEEWQSLIAATGGIKTAGSSLKDRSGIYWKKSKNEGSNQSGFTALPAGSRDNAGKYSNMGKYAFFWTTTSVKKKPEHLYMIDSGFMRDSLMISGSSPEWGYSIRCVKD